MFINTTKALYDAFGRQRFSAPYTLFDSKQLGDNRALFWDDVETSGGGTNSVYTAANSETVLSVGAETAGTRVRQTFQRFNYQPGKSQLIFMTGVIGAGAVGITKRWGYFDENDGVFFELDGTTLKTVVRKGGTDRAIIQDNWNVSYPVPTRSTLAAENEERLWVRSVEDDFDGADNSKVNINLDKANIFVIDIEWLGVGTVRFGVVIDGFLIYVNDHHHANLATSTYMRTPNLPLRYELSNSGTGSAATMSHICTTVISEGGQEETGILRYESTASTHVDANVVGTLYAVLGIRLKSTHLDNIVKIVNVSMLNMGSGEFEWVLVLNPTIAGADAAAIEWVAVSDSAVEIAKGDTANTVTNGVALTGGVISSDNFGGGGERSLDSLRYIGSRIDGTPDELVLCVRPYVINADIQASITWRETS